MRRRILVLDASAILSWLHADEADDTATRAMEDLKHDLAMAYAPLLLRYEILNNIGLSLRRGRITPVQAQTMLSRFHALPIKFDSQGMQMLDYDAQILQWMASKNLTAYDAVYLELAHRLDGTLVTLDLHLRKAAAR